MTTIYLIRHAESEGNLFRLCQGQDEEILSRTGQAQLRALSARFRDVPLAAVYTSDLYRTAATAQAVAKSRRLRIEPVRALREIALGPLEGLSWGDVYHQLPQLRTSSVHEFDLPGCESRAAVSLRMREALTAIARRHDGACAAAVSHGGAIAAFLDAVFPDRMPDFAGNTSVTTLHFDHDAWELIQGPEVSHLERSGIPSSALFSPDITDLRFEPVDFRRDRELLVRTGQDAWRTVFGTLEGYSAESFLAGASRMAAHPLMASLCLDGSRHAGVLLLDSDQRDEPGVGHISLIYLEPEYRHRGLGMQLIGHAVTAYRRQGRDTLRLHVAQHNRSAIRLYRKCGFRFATVPYSISGQLVMKKSISIPQII